MFDYRGAEGQTSLINKGDTRREVWDQMRPAGGQVQRKGGIAQQ